MRTERSDLVPLIEGRLVSATSRAWRLLRQEQGRLVCDTAKNGRWTVLVTDQSERKYQLLPSEDFTTFAAARRMCQAVEAFLEGLSTTTNAEDGINKLASMIEKERREFNAACDRAIAAIRKEC